MPKANRYSHKRYLDYVRSHVSCIEWDQVGPWGPIPLQHDMTTGSLPTVAHHVRMGAGAGIGQKPSDFLTVPLTDEQHRWLHQIGERTFWHDKLRLDPYAVIKGLLMVWTGIVDGDEELTHADLVAHAEAMARGDADYMGATR